MITLLQAPDVPEQTWKWSKRFFLFFAGLYLIFGLNYPLINVTETRAAEVAREILSRNDWTTLHLNFEPYFHKPPLFYWLCAASFSFFGINEFAARLVPALASFGSLWLTVHFASRWVGSRIGLLSGIVLFLSSGFIGLSRFLVCDPVFAFFCTATSFTGYEAIVGSMDSSKPFRGRGWMVLCGLSCGLGLLTKGPVIGVLCGVPFVYAIFFIHRNRSLNWIYVMWAIAACGFIVAPWMAWTASISPDYLAEFVMLHNVQRFSGGFHEEPVWYFIPVLIIEAHPWSSMSVPFICRLMQRRPFPNCSTQLFHYLLATGLWCVMFFSMSRGKLPTYILPAAAPLSITMAIYFQALFSRSPVSKMEKMSTVLSPIMAMIASIAFVMTYWAIAPIPWSPEYRASGTLGVTVAFAICLMGLFLYRKRPLGIWWMGAMSISFCFSSWLCHCVIPNVGQTTTCLGMTDSLEHRQLVHQAPQVVTIGKPYYDAMFYAQRDDFVKYEEFDGKQIQSDLYRYKTLVLIAPPETKLDSLQQWQEIKLRTIATHPRYVLYQLESDGPWSR